MILDGLNIFSILDFSNNTSTLPLLTKYSLALSAQIDLNCNLNDLLTVQEIADAQNLLIQQQNISSDSIQDSFESNKILIFQPTGNGTAVLLNGIVNSATGTATTRNVSASNFFMSGRRIGFVSGVILASSCGTRTGMAQFFIGNGVLGGFYMSYTFGISDAIYVNNSKTFVGLNANVSAIASSVDFNTATNLIGICNNAGETNFSVVCNDSTGNSTLINLGSDFPCNTTNTDVIRFILRTGDSGNIWYQVINLSSGISKSGELTSNLPSSNTLLASQVWRTNGSLIASAVGIDVFSIYGTVKI